MPGFKFQIALLVALAIAQPVEAIPGEGVTLPRRFALLVDCTKHGSNKTFRLVGPCALSLISWRVK